MQESDTCFQIRRDACSMQTLKFHPPVGSKGIKVVAIIYYPPYNCSFSYAKINPCIYSQTRYITQPGAIPCFYRIKIGLTKFPIPVEDRIKQRKIYCLKDRKETKKKKSLSAIYYQQVATRSI